LAGNKRFMFGKSEQTPEHPIIERFRLAQGQEPFAIILSCSDSRVSPEIVFDEWLGDLFVVRTAGHVVDDVALGSIEYAVEHLHSSLLLVLGHERCGAVTAALEGGHSRGHIHAVTMPIWNAIDECGNKPTVDEVVRMHARLTAKELASSRPVLARAVRRHELVVLAARYDLESGKVKVLDE